MTARNLALLACGVSLAAACAAGRTAHDDFRDVCAAAAKAHMLAAEQATAGQIKPAAFATLDDAFDQMAARCRASLTPAE